MKHLNIRIYGFVQGVFFRSYAKEMAESLGICGSVCNESDGTVLIEAEGDESAIDQFVLWCHQGPNSARVERVEKKEGEMKDYDSFEIRYIS